jgi:serine/threonine-protein kinase
VPLSDIASSDLTDQIIAAVVRDVGDALVFAHKNGVLHLDIKPANLIVDHSGRVKIIDFGVSALSQASGASTASAGSVGYMPYEQIAGQAVTPATDEWAYAAVIYELLTDEFPYEEQFSAVRGQRRAPDELTTMQRLQFADEPALLQTRNAALNEALATALLRNPASRFASVKDLRKALLAALPASTQGRKQLKEIVAAITDDSVDEYHDSSPGVAPSPFSGCFSSIILGCLVATAVLLGPFLY